MQKMAFQFGPAGSELPTGGTSYVSLSEEGTVVVLTDRKTDDSLNGRVIFDQGDREPRSSHALMVIFPIPAEEQPQFDAWFCNEHAPLLLAIDGWERSRLVAVSGKISRVVWHDLAGADPLRSSGRAAAGRTPASSALVERPWFTRVRRHELERAS
ncbi:MAG: hypothetical protein GEU78_13430 [Actinobacteria bacterium]|nr:hypothetical protein [Actinomycetota bacterium]